MSEPADIVVSGYSDRYARAVKELLRVEGGFVDDPVDRGGATKYGISLRFLAAEGAFDADEDGKADFDLDFDGDIDGLDIRRLRRGDAVFLYHRCFWKPLGADDFAPPLGEAMFDQAVNGGMTAARKLLQRAVNACIRKGRLNLAPLLVDGGLGEKTHDAYRAVLTYPALGMPALIMAYRKATADRYRAIVEAHPEQNRFLKGWLRRAAELGAHA